MAHEKVTIELEYNDDNAAFEAKSNGKKIRFNFTASDGLIAVPLSNGLVLDLQSASLTVDHFLMWHKDLRRIYGALETYEQNLFTWYRDVEYSLTFQSDVRTFVVSYDMENDRFLFYHSPVPLSNPAGVYSQTWKIIRRWIDLGFTLPAIV